MFKNEKMSAWYESPSAVVVQIATEGVLCESGTEKLGEIFGEWESEN